MDLIEVFGLGVVGLQVFIGDRPGWRYPVVVLEFTEIFLAHAKQRCTIELRRAAHEVIRPWLKGSTAVVVPGVLRDIAVLEEDYVDIPVLFLTRQKGAALQEQNAFARGCQTVRQRATAGTRADDDHVIVFHGRSLLLCAALL